MGKCAVADFLNVDYLKPSVVMAKKTLKCTNNATKIRKNADFF